MPEFLYKLANQRGEIKEGSISAFTKKRAEKKLMRDGSLVISISPKRINFLQKILSFSVFGEFSRTEKINFFRNLSAMIASGISIVEALEILSEQAKDNKVKKAIATITNDTRNGQKLAKAMARFPKYFPESLVETVNMGDISGRLTNTLGRIATDLEKDEELRKKISGAIAYPIVLIFMMIVVVITFAFYILPKIEEVFRGVGAPLPLPTKIILYGGELVKNNPLILLGTIIGIILFFFLVLKIKKGHYAIHYLMLRIPIFGELIKEYNLILFFRSLESLFSSGVSLVHAVEVAKKTTTNDVYKKVFDKVYPVLLHGVPFTNAIAPFPFLFSKQTQKIIWVGEKTGKLDESLNRITDYYEKSVDYKTRMLTVLIEPILMIFIGIVVGGLALSIFLPIYKLIDAI